MTGLLWGVVHWRSVIGDRPLCGATADEPSTQQRDRVTCVGCLEQLAAARKRARRRGGE